ncbi:hypothetical protein TVAG_296380 [Trichomonas vaginalis G3]|uniref:Uncharacterized protein n=1 Tax=Trichomonas vaginalis (strain ATCC PRA-98 / G3) TaxID=412133 RepID=A2F786_TRIV3|nr:FMN binding [Trichomonas vaginalis G3]EAX99253.1 hypothetical protein TVAG_296380 [Trichomonas vaginalis G3]KAI5547928.1 FMN binding [Trichomonas vaginalis G3]|eukprot:XP_001312183.1 hypothetical protein [Trichomonas vaginalis G3]
MNKAIELGCDLVSFGRPTIADPFMVQHLMESKSIKCISYNKCFMNHHIQPVKCYAF